MRGMYTKYIITKKNLYQNQIALAKADNTYKENIKIKKEIRLYSIWITVLFVVGNNILRTAKWNKAKKSTEYS